MYSKSKIETERFYWDKQIERHHTGKRIRHLARQIKEMPYKKLAEKLSVNRRTIWAIANGLATASQDFISNLERLENGKL